MKVEINIDSEQFETLLNDNLADLPKETIQNIIIECIREYFAQNNCKNIEKLFIEKTSNRWSEEYCASLFLKNLAGQCDYSKLQDVVDTAIDTVKKNHEKILRDVFLDAIADRLCHTYNLRESIQQVLWEREQQAQLN